MTQTPAYLAWLAISLAATTTAQFNWRGICFYKEKKHKNVGGQRGKLSRQMFALQMIVAH